MARKVWLSDVAAKLDVWLPYAFVVGTGAHSGAPEQTLLKKAKMMEDGCLHRFFALLSRSTGQIVSSLRQVTTVCVMCY